MVIYVGRDGVLRPGYLNDELARLKALYIDLERLKLGAPPSFDELENAPFIDDYVFVQRGVTALAGEITGHPLLGTTSGITSDLYAFAPGLGWARTHSRLYKLGSPSHDVARWVT